VNWLITGLHGYGRAEREKLIRACPQGKRPPVGPPGATAILTRHAPLAAVVTDFSRKLRNESRQTPYPLEAIRRVFAPRQNGSP